MPHPHEATAPKQTTAGAGTTRRSLILGAPLIVPSSVFGALAPGNRVHLAAFGVGGRGSADTNAINQVPEARFLAVCDCCQSRREENRQQWNKLYGGDYVSGTPSETCRLSRAWQLRSGSTSTVTWRSFRSRTRARPQGSPQD